MILLLSSNKDSEAQFFASEYSLPHFLFVFELYVCVLIKDEMKGTEYFLDDYNTTDAILDYDEPGKNFRLCPTPQ